MKGRHVLTAALAAVAALTVGCQADPAERGEAPPTPRAAAPDTTLAEALRPRVTGEAMMAHLQALQDIADAHDGNRAAGTAGYDASVDYVATALRDAGFDVATPEFTFRVFEAGEPSLVVGGSPVTASVLSYSAATGADGVTGPLVAAPADDDDPGCSASDYDGLPVRGAVALVDRGTCPFEVKEAAAAERGAVALIVADNTDADRVGGTLGDDNTDVQLPVVAVTKADGARLREQPRMVTLRVDARTDTLTSRNVVAQTRTGSTDNVVMAGAHLDSVPEGPGINDNGSGVAAVLETALALGSSPEVANAVRFAFWGAEEVGLIGSQRYVESLDVEALRRIALYLNFDMIGSPNAGYLTYDGDLSAPPERSGAARVPEGSAGIERTLVAYLRSAGKAPEDTFFDGRSDYAAFTQAGVPAGGIFSGASEEKTPEQAREWGGQAGEPFDPSYHKPTDTIDSIDRTAQEINGQGVAYAVGIYARDVGGRNGVPELADRTRHAVSES